MSARSTMTMRATVTRNVTATENADNWGQPTAGDGFEEIGVIACQAWSTMRRGKDDAGKDAVIEDMRALVPVDSDVKNGDQLVISDRVNEVQFSGPVFVDAAQRIGGHGSRPSHIELMLRRHL